MSCSQPFVGPELLCAFQLEVGGTVQRDPKKVRVEGEGLDGGRVGERMTFLVIAPDTAGPGPLEVWPHRTLSGLKSI